MVIVGGVYREICQFPEYRSVLGSGGRAAAALSLLDEDVVLHSYVPASRVNEVRINFSPYGFELVDHPSKHLIAFRYLHGLAAPAPEPTLGLLAPESEIAVNGPLVLRFGMVEGSARVDADTAIYDPQAPLNPGRFTANGSTAKRLAYVVNTSEAKLLSKCEIVEDQIHWLHANEGAAVVVLKNGPHGASISDGRRIVHVPCFKTSHVWPIGSGDVFSVAFAHFWGKRGLQPADAGHKASLAAAYYCSTNSLPLPKDFEAQVDAKPLRPSGKKANECRIYLAGPFFTLPQRWLIDNLRETLASLHVSVFSPIHDVGEGPPNEVAVADLAAVDKSQVLLAVLDGLDAGTLVEVGYAIAKHVPVVAFSQVEDKGNLTMLVGTGCDVERDLVTAIYKAVWIALEA